jgi:hypothetical protein
MVGDRTGVVLSCEGVEKAVEEEKDVTFFVDPAPKINLVEAHLNRPSLRVKRTIALHRIKRSWNASRASLQMKGVVEPAPTSRWPWVEGRSKVYLMY